MPLCAGSATRLLVPLDADALSRIVLKLDIGELVLAAAAAAVLAEQERAAAEEQERRDDLSARAARWHQATQIRAYIADLYANGSADAQWRAGALQVADEIDPRSGRLQPIGMPPTL